MTDLRQTAAVTRFEIFEIESPLVTPYTMSRGTLATTRGVLLKLVDADGVVGWGEANPALTFSGETPRSVRRAWEDLLLPAVLSHPAPEPGRVDRDLDALLPGNLCAKGAITMALLDLLGKRLEVPAAGLLGGPVRKSLPVLWPLGNGSADDDSRVIDERAAQGFTTFMLKMGAAPVDEEVERVAALTDRYGDRLTLIPDANQGWTREQARRFLGSVDGRRVAFVEQPLSKDDLAGMAELSGAGGITVSADESVIRLADAVEIARTNAAGVVSLKSSKNGGPLRARRIATVANAFGIGCYMNSMVEFGISQAASLHLAMTIDDLVDAGHAYMSTLRLAEDPTDFGSFVHGGEVHLPERPGLGVHVDEEHVRRMTVSEPGAGQLY